MSQLKKFIAAPEAVHRVDWKAMLARFEIGDKQLFKDFSQARLAGHCAWQNSHTDKRFVTKKAEQGAYIIRVK